MTFSLNDRHFRKFAFYALASVAFYVICFFYLLADYHRELQAREDLMIGDFWQFEGFFGAFFLVFTIYLLIITISTLIFHNFQKKSLYHQVAIVIWSIFYGLFLVRFLPGEVNSSEKINPYQLFLTEYAFSVTYFALAVMLIFFIIAPAIVAHNKDSDSENKTFGEMLFFLLKHYREFIVIWSLMAAMFVWGSIFKAFGIILINIYQIAIKQPVALIRDCQ
jgi:hypothetical protein